MNSKNVVEAKALVVLKLGKMPQIERLFLGTLGPGVVRVKVEASGICHSDLGNWNGDFPVTPLPLIIGHEGSGIIEEVGPGITDLQPGDHVSLLGRPNCGNCEFCNAGKPVLCIHGIDPMLNLNVKPYSPTMYLGTLSDRMNVPEKSVYKMNDIPLKVRSLFGCLLTTAYGAVVVNAKVFPGSRVAVFGSGGIGLACAMFARAAGASEVVVFGRNPNLKELALKIGATSYSLTPECSPENDSAMTAALKIAAPKIFKGNFYDGFDFAFDATGFAPMLTTAIFSLHATGTAVLVGIPPYNKNTVLTSAPFIICEKKIITSFGCGANVIHVTEMILRMYRSGQLPIEHIVSKIYTSLDDYPQICDDLNNGRIQGRALLVFPPSSKL